MSIWLCTTDSDLTSKTSSKTCPASFSIKAPQLEKFHLVLWKHTISSRNRNEIKERYFRSWEIHTFWHSIRWGTVEKINRSKQRSVSNWIGMVSCKLSQAEENVGLLALPTFKLAFSRFFCYLPKYTWKNTTLPCWTYL